MFKHLLIPLDGTAMAEAVLPPAALLARAAGASVTLLHVIERGAPASVHGERHLATAAGAEEYLKDVSARFFSADIPVARHVHAREVRNVAHSVADHSDEMGPDLVIMRAHGEAGVRALLFGNIPQQVVSQSAAPVLLFQPPGQDGPGFPFHSILSPLDGKPEHEMGLCCAVGMAQLCKAPLQMLSVVPTVGALSGAPAAAGALLPEAMRAALEMDEEQAASYLARYVEIFSKQGMQVAARVSRGEPEEQIAEMALEMAADLVVLGTHGKAGTEAFWAGSVAQKVLRRLKTSFLLAPPSR